MRNFTPPFDPDPPGFGLKDPMIDMPRTPKAPKQTETSFSSEVFPELPPLPSIHSQGYGV